MKFKIACQILSCVVLLSACGGRPSQPQSALFTATLPPHATASMTVVSSITLTPTTASPADGMPLVYVPAGEFRMGNEVDAKPIHEVYLDAYWIDMTEVTNAMYAIFVQATGYRTVAEQNGKTWVKLFISPGSNELSSGELSGADWRHPQGPDSSIVGLENHPVVQVAWKDALAYCNWAGRRLPTEAQWEKAARGTLGWSFPWGNTDPVAEIANGISDEDGYLYTAPVGSYPLGVSAYGAYDLAGNVEEWVSDWVETHYYYASPYVNPTGPNSSVFNVRSVRGGGWASDLYWITSSHRGEADPEFSTNALGFRCVLPDIENTPPSPTLAVTVPVICGEGYTRLLPGIYGRVTPGSLPNRLRQGPSTSEEVIGLLQPGTIVRIGEGPICSDGLVFWHVTSDTDSTIFGWTSEGDGVDYWLEPYTP